MQSDEAASLIASIVGAVASAASASASVYQATRPGPKVPEMPKPGPTVEDQMQQMAASEDVRRRRGRGATILTGGSRDSLGTGSLGGQGLKTVLGA